MEVAEGGAAQLENQQGARFQARCDACKKWRQLRRARAVDHQDNRHEIGIAQQRGRRADVSAGELELRRGIEPPGAQGAARQQQ
jgi:hypothetical protein